MLILIRNELMMGELSKETTGNKFNVSIMMSSTSGGASIIIMRINLTSHEGYLHTWLVFLIYILNDIYYARRLPVAPHAHAYIPPQLHQHVNIAPTISYK